ncbi:hypothetical protein JTE90_016814 [Oedothorax gibbosus]|uniref:Uncharacterized protein n=1 Tax=Oedothorax gibbosus TaxID=931172 RepID=A0AAV6VXK6_9ARAC|nr:hypothetical protein JTE90_016814 [Oedothorax gibbosus]
MLETGNCINYYLSPPPNILENRERPSFDNVQEKEALQNILKAPVLGCDSRTITAHGCEYLFIPPSLSTEEFLFNDTQKTHGDIMVKWELGVRQR